VPSPDLSGEFETDFRVFLYLRFLQGYAAQEENWRWPLYMLLFISVFCVISLSFLFPETSSATILLRRAQRLRKLTGNSQLRSQSEIDSAGIKPKELITTSLFRPFLLLRDPAVLFVDLYIALVYVSHR